MLCKCSGKYIDIYFKLKITFSVHGSPLMCNLLVFTVISNPFMSGVNIDEPGFTAPASSAPP